MMERKGEKDKLLWFFRGGAIGTEGMMLWCLIDSFKYSTISVNAYRISLVITMVMAVVAFMLTFLPDEFTIMSLDREETQKFLNEEETKAYMAKIESFKLEDDSDE